MRTFIICALMLLVAIPCEARKKQKPVVKTPQEIKAMTSRQFECEKKLILRASISMLQSEGFMIEDTDLEVGLIKASKRIEADKKKAHKDLLLKGRSVDATTAKFMIYIDELNEQLSDVRITVYEGMEMTIGGGIGYRPGGAPNVTESMTQDASVYGDWFNALSAEIERLKALQ